MSEKPDRPVCKTAMDFSGVVVCYNEAEQLRECLQSIAFCRELIVVDLGSEDASLEVAARYADRILTHELVPFANQPRQYGISQATHEWVVTIDPDEVFPAGEIFKIEKILMEKPDLDAVRVPIQFFFRGKEINCTQWARPGLTRWTVIHRDRAKRTPLIHTEFAFDQNIYFFSWDEIKPIRHFWAASYGDLIRQEWRYVKHEGERLYETGKRFTWFRMMKAGIISLKINLLNHRGIKGGWDGICLSILRSLYHIFAWLELKKYQKRTDAEKVYR